MSVAFEVRVAGQNGQRKVKTEPIKKVLTSLTHLMEVRENVDLNAEPELDTRKDMGSLLRLFDEVTSVTNAAREIVKCAENAQECIGQVLAAHCKSEPLKTDWGEVSVLHKPVPEPRDKDFKFSDDQKKAWGHATRHYVPGPITFNHLQASFAESDAKLIWDSRSTHQYLIGKKRKQSSSPAPQAVSEEAEQGTEEDPAAEDDDDDGGEIVQEEAD